MLLCFFYSLLYLRVVGKGELQASRQIVQRSEPIGSAFWRLPHQLVYYLGLPAMSVSDWSDSLLAVPGGPSEATG